MGDLPGHTMAMHPLARTKPSGQMYVGCHCALDAAYVNSVRLNFCMAVELSDASGHMSDQFSRGPSTEVVAISYVRLVGARPTHRLINRLAIKAAYTWMRTPLIP